MSALLELGAGFNPEFTGKQNVYINAAILGLGKSEIDAIYQPIVDFADIGHFIDQPVKLYSSGMYVRLAFAMAISVNPEILIVDEALAVGDTLFQAKCFAKFREFQDKGITILFVTHALEMITSVCSSAFLLEKGAILSQGDPKKVVDAYNRLLSTEPEEMAPGKNEGCASNEDDNCLSHEVQWQKKFKINPKQSRYGNGKAEIIEAGIFSSETRPEQVLTKGDVYEFRMKVRFNELVRKPIYAYTIKDIKGFSITGTNTMFQKVETEDGKPGPVYVASFRQKMVLNQGGYLLSFGCTGFENGEFIVYERRYDYMAFEVISERPGIGFVDMDPDVFVSKMS